MTRRPRTAPAALALLAVLATTGLTACGGEEDASSSAEGSSSATPQTEASPSGTATSEAPEAPEAELDGTQEVSTDQVVLRIPEDWQSLDAAEALDGAGGEDDTLLTTIAERLQVPREQLAQTLQNVDLLAVAGGGAEGGVLTNLNVLHQPGRLPEEEQLAQQLEQFADRTGDVARVDSEVGEVLRADYVLDIDGQEGRFEVLLAEVGSDLVTITVTSADAGDAAEVADLVLASLRTA